MVYRAQHRARHGRLGRPRSAGTVPQNQRRTTMPDAVIVSAVRTPVATAFKGTLRDTPAEDLATLVVKAALERSGVRPEDVDDVIMGEVHAGGGDLARYAAVAAGLTH